MLMKFEEDGIVKGWADASEQEAIDLKALGYVESSEEERNEVIAKKHTKSTKSDTIQTASTQREAVKGKPGRKSKSLASLGGSNGDSSTISQS